MRYGPATRRAGDRLRRARPGGRCAAGRAAQPALAGHRRELLLHHGRPLRERVDRATTSAGCRATASSSGFDPTGGASTTAATCAGIIRRLDYIEGLGTHVDLAHAELQEPAGAAAGHAERPALGRLSRLLGHRLHADRPAPGHATTTSRDLVDAAHARGHEGLLRHHHQPHRGRDRVRRGRAARLFSKDDCALPRPPRARRSTTATTPARTTFPALDPDVSFPYHPVLPAGAQHKVPDWLNDITLYHNRGDTTFTGEDSALRRLLRPRRPLHRASGRGRRDDRHLQDLDRRLRYRRLPHRHDEARQRRVLAAVRAGGARVRARPGQVGVLHVRRGRRRDEAVHVALHDDQPHAERAGLPVQERPRWTSRRARVRRSALGDFFVDDDWYTDADSNVYQLPTFVGNHDDGPHRPRSSQVGNPGRRGLGAGWPASGSAHELMYLSRGNPVVYYGDEQGFTGDGGDQLARQDMFPSQVAGVQRRRPDRHRPHHRGRELRSHASALPRDRPLARGDRATIRRCATAPTSTATRRRERASTPSRASARGAARVRRRAQQRRDGEVRVDPDVGRSTAASTRVYGSGAARLRSGAARAGCASPCRRFRQSSTSRRAESRASRRRAGGAPRRAVAARRSARSAWTCTPTSTPTRSTR